MTWPDSIETRSMLILGLFFVIRFFFGLIRVRRFLMSHVFAYTSHSVEYSFPVIAISYSNRISSSRKEESTTVHLSQLRWLAILVVSSFTNRNVWVLILILIILYNNFNYFNIIMIACDAPLFNVFHFS